MTRALRLYRIYSAIAAVTAKQFLQWRIWFWVQLVSQTVLLVAWFSFWQSAYAGHRSIGGLHGDQTVRYILLARLLAPLVQWGLVGAMASWMRQGLIAAELLRPTDFQARFFVMNLASTASATMQVTLPAGLIAALFLGLRITAGPATWAAFLLTMFLGVCLMFFSDYLIATLVFYITEAWGLAVLQAGIFTLTSGALIPLAMLPGPMRVVCAWLPFSHAMYVPVSLLSGITPLSQLPGLLLADIAWIAGLLLASRLAFSRAVRSITIQGG